MSDSFPKDERVETADGAKDAAADIATGPRVKSMAELLAMDWSEMNKYLVEIGADPISDDQRERARDAVLVDLGDDALAMDRGRLSAGAVERLQASAEKALVTQAREQANAFMAAEERKAMFAEDPRPRMEQGGVWISVGSGCCDDCTSLHGTILAQDYWDGIAPEDGVNACGHKCRCKIMPCSIPADAEGLRAEDLRN